MSRPVLLVIAGPNGSGKTTVTKRLQADLWSEGVEYINPDDIAQERFGDWNSQEAILAAARWAEERRELLMSERQGIAFETVLSASDKIEFIRRAKACGYFVRTFFIGTSDAGINATRVAHRIEEGGHGVPLEKIIARYDRSMANLSPALQLSDRAYVFDNSIDGVEALLCARSENGLLKKTYGDTPRWVNEAVAPLAKHPEFESL